MRLIDGRPELGAEIAAAPDGLRAYVADGFERLSRRPDFLEVIEAALPLGAESAPRAEVVARRWRSIAGS